MAKMKEFVFDVIDALTASNMDYEKVAEQFGISPSEVYEIASEYGDVE